MKNKWPKLKKAGLQWNPYEWGQGVKVIDYANANPSIVKNSRASIDGLRDTAKLIKECQATLQKKDDAKELDICMQGKLTKAIEFPKLLEGDKNSSDTKSAAKKHQRHTTTIEPSLEEDEQPQRPMHMQEVSDRENSESENGEGSENDQKFFEIDTCYSFPELSFNYSERSVSLLCTIFILSEAECIFRKNTYTI
ncbi:unnamed protein product [Trichogramma brassicae]|uniref:Uncharacterized protein n=1 Tax=Trichogramma brassicae TaxID=86971 RepID=A0A6H5I7X7_9HYME|nr:unnamed protein product [Trichogramma brassicae]